MEERCSASPCLNSKLIVLRFCLLPQIIMNGDASASTLALGNMRAVAAAPSPSPLPRSTTRLASAGTYAESISDSKAAPRCASHILLALHPILGSGRLLSQPPGTEWNGSLYSQGMGARQTLSTPFPNQSRLQNRSGSGFPFCTRLCTIMVRRVDFVRDHQLFLLLDQLEVVGGGRLRMSMYSPESMSSAR